MLAMSMRDRSKYAGHEYAGQDYEAMIIRDKKDAGG